jgi:molybdopterin-binding protein
VRLPTGVELWVSASAAFSSGAAVQVSYRPEDIALSARDAQHESSARNVFRLRVTTISPQGGLIRVGLDGVARLAVIITRTSAEQMRLEPGVEVYAHLKAAALHAFAAAKP